MDDDDIVTQAFYEFYEAYMFTVFKNYSKYVNHNLFYTVIVYVCIIVNVMATSAFASLKCRVLQPLKVGDVVVKPYSGFVRDVSGSNSVTVCGQDLIKII